MKPCRRQDDQRRFSCHKEWTFSRHLMFHRLQWVLSMICLRNFFGTRLVSATPSFQDCLLSFLPAGGYSCLPRSRESRRRTTMRCFKFYWSTFFCVSATRCGIGYMYDPIFSLCDFPSLHTGICYFVSLSGCPVCRV